MYITLHTEQFNPKHVYIGDKKNNNIISSCYFSHIYYSTDNFTLNNIVFEINIHTIKTIQQINNMVYINFNSYQPENYNMLLKLIQIEESILKYYLGSNGEKLTESFISNIIKKGCIRIIVREDDNIDIESIDKKVLPVLLRVSGVWENLNNDVGLIYKFLMPTQKQIQ